MGEVRVGIPGGDDLALLGQPEAAANGARRLSADRAARRPAAASDAAAAPVEEREPNAQSGAHARDGLLGLIERPARREISAVLVAVGIADHHHLMAGPAVVARL